MLIDLYNKIIELGEIKLSHQIGSFVVDLAAGTITKIGSSNKSFKIGELFRLIKINFKTRYLRVDIFTAS